MLIALPQQYLVRQELQNAKYGSAKNKRPFIHQHMLLEQLTKSSN
jgi:hypothetical protein